MDAWIGVQWAKTKECQETKHDLDEGLHDLEHLRSMDLFRQGWGKFAWLKMSVGHVL